MSDVFVYEGVEYPYCYDVNGLKVFTTHEWSESDIMADALSQTKRIKCRPDYVLLKLTDDGWVEGQPMLGNPPKFERIRRITGYLVGTLDRFNDAKRAEESQRVKHSV